MERWTIKVPAGEVSVLADSERNKAVVILVHGAGSHMEHKTMEWLATLVRETGVAIVRFNFPYRVAGRSIPDRMPVLIESYRAVIESVGQVLAPVRLMIGGHSMGGRVASMLEAETKTADGLLLFGYPLHPAGQLEKLRDAHLEAIATPTLQLNGTQDELCNFDTMQAVVSRLDPTKWKLVWIEGADHSYSVKKLSGRHRQDVESDIRDALATWAQQLSSGNLRQS